MSGPVYGQISITREDIGALAKGAFRELKADLAKPTGHAPVEDNRPDEIFLLVRKHDHFRYSAETINELPSGIPPIRIPSADSLQACRALVRQTYMGALQDMRICETRAEAQKRATEARVEIADVM